MPLTLSLEQGQDLMIGGRRFVVEEVLLPRGVTLLDVEKNVEHQIKAAEAIEVMPDVFMSDGFRALAATARLVIDAPRAIKILRGDVARKDAAKR